MRKRLLCGLLLGGLCAMHAVADSSAAEIQSRPSPITKTSGFEITITTSDFGQEVYCYTWTVGGSQPEFAWADAISEKYRMTGSGGVYTLSVDNLQEFYGLNDTQLASVTKLGFIARTKSGSQTDDCFVEVIDRLYSGGDGSAASPYLISGMDDLKTLASTPEHMSKCFRLDADIENAGDFAGIGSMETPFTGEFDGACHTISGLNVHRHNAAIGSATGFFNAVGGEAHIHSLGVKNATVTGVTYCGVLAGHVASGTIERCYTSGSVTGTSICIGGLAGMNGGHIADCYSTADVTSDGDYAAGGLAGKNTGLVERTYASGDVTAHNYVGAVIGANYGTVLHSVAMNLNITSTAGSLYAGRFGGNNNGENTVSHAAARAGEGNQTDTNLSWDEMRHSQAEWSDLAHHAISANQALGDKATYASGLGWDFSGTWEWVGNDTYRPEASKTEQRYPVLASIDGQEAPASQQFYDMTGIEVAGADAAGGISVWPTSVDNTLTVTAPAPIASLRLTAVNGAVAAVPRACGANEQTIDLSSAASGVYLLGVTLADGTSASFKIVKK